MGRASVPTPAVYPAFFFVLEKAVKGAGNAVIPTFPAHCPHGLQHLRRKRPTFAFVGESGYTRHPSPEPRTQRLTRRNTGRFGWGWYHYPRSVPHVHKHPRAGYQKGVLCRFWALAEGTPEGVAAPLGCVIFSVSVEIAACMPCAQGLSVCARRGVVSLPSARFTCC